MKVYINFKFTGMSRTHIYMLIGPTDYVSGLWHTMHFVTKLPKILNHFGPLKFLSKL